MVTPPREHDDARGYVWRERPQKRFFVLLLLTSLRVAMWLCGGWMGVKGGGGVGWPTFRLGYWWRRVGRRVHSKGCCDRRGGERRLGLRKMQIRVLRHIYLYVCCVFYMYYKCLFWPFWFIKVIFFLMQNIYYRYKKVLECYPRECERNVQGRA